MLDVPTTQKRKYQPSINRPVLCEEKSVPGPFRTVEECTGEERPASGKDKLSSRDKGLCPSDMVLASPLLGS